MSTANANAESKANISTTQRQSHEETSILMNEQEAATTKPCDHHHHHHHDSHDDEANEDRTQWWLKAGFLFVALLDIVSIVSLALSLPNEAYASTDFEMGISDLMLCVWLRILGYPLLGLWACISGTISGQKHPLAACCCPSDKGETRVE